MAIPSIKSTDTSTTNNKLQNCNEENKNNSNNVSNSNYSRNNVNNNNNNQNTIVPLTPRDSEKHAPPTSPNILHNQSLKQRINSLVMKTLADNTEKDRNFVAAAANNVTSNNKIWKLKVLQTTRDLLRQTSCAVSFECEGINMGVKRQLTLFQIGLQNGQAYILDCHCNT